MTEIRTEEILCLEIDFVTSKHLPGWFRFLGNDRTLEL